MIVTSDGALAARLRRLREHGMDVSAADRHRSSQPVIEHYTEVGFNFRMTDVQAAVGLVQLGRLSAIVARRRELAQRYTRLLSGLAGVQTIFRDPDYGSTNFQSFWMLLPEDAAVTRDDLLSLLAESGVSARRGIMAAHLEPAYHGFTADPLPVTERLTAHSLILPLFHQMTEAEQDLVVSVLCGALQAKPAAPSRDLVVAPRSARHRVWRVRPRDGGGGAGDQRGRWLAASGVPGRRPRTARQGR